ncbi:hypothetical protein BDY17DRAFT_261631, partial [Neohortaea acidophila]
MAKRRRLNPRPSRSSIPESNHDSTTTPPEISEDDTCPVCQLLLYRPVKTGCNHTLCQSCMATWAEVSLSHEMQIVDIDTDIEDQQSHQPFDAAEELEARCPMCRTQTTASLDQVRSQELQTKYPEAYTQRLAEGTPSDPDTTQTLQTLTLHIGNTHQLTTPTQPVDVSDPTPPNRHAWTFFLRPSNPHLLEEVHIHLQPTFRPARVIRTRPPFEVSRLGWGTFTVTAQILLKAGYSWVHAEAQDSPDGAEGGMLGVEWRLDFAGRGSMGRLRVRVR